MVSGESAQVPLLIVHIKEEEAPIVKEFATDIGTEGLAARAVPDKVVQAPVPTAGVFAARVVEVAEHIT